MAAQLKEIPPGETLELAAELLAWLEQRKPRDEFWGQEVALALALQTYTGIQSAQRLLGVVR